MTGTEMAIRAAEASMTTKKDMVSASSATTSMTQIEDHPSWEMLSQLRITLRAAVALSRFRVRDLLELKEGQVFETLSADTDDVNLLAGQLQLGWSEFEVIEQQMAVRLTRLR